MNIALLKAQHCLMTLRTIRPTIRMTRKSGFISGSGLFIFSSWSKLEAIFYSSKLCLQFPLTCSSTLSRLLNHNIVADVFCRRWFGNLIQNQSHLSEKSFILIIFQILGCQFFWILMKWFHSNIFSSCMREILLLILFSYRRMLDSSLNPQN